MPDDDKLQTHLWPAGHALHQVEQDGRTIRHQRCVRCWRDFGQGFDGTYNWEAVYVGVLRIERLAERVTDIWLSEPCPGEPRIEDNELRAMRRA